MTEQPDQPDSRPCILVVDDSTTVALALVRMLRSDGYEAHRVSDGEAALTWIEERLPDLCLLDINMPGLNGYDVCRRLKTNQRTRDVPVIFISGLDAAADVAQAFAVGGVDYVVKPPRPPEVLARVATHLRLRQLHQQLEAKNLALSGSYQRLKQMEELRDELIHMVVHDMRSPLAGIVGILDLVVGSGSGGGPLDREDVACLQQAMAAAQRLTEMVNSLLDVNRLEEGKMPLNLSSQSLVSLVDEAVVSFGDADLGGRLTIDAGGAIANASCDGHLVVRVVGNLLSNAMQFSGTREPIVVRVSTLGEHLKVAVTDRGPGVAPGDRQRIFEKYTQGRGQPPMERSKGFGLGLAFCRLAIEAQGGRVGVDSEPGCGATFWFTLPSDSI